MGTMKSNIWIIEFQILEVLLYIKNLEETCMNFFQNLYELLKALPVH